MKTKSPRARKTDPQTSHAAARSVEGLRQRQSAVLSLLREYGPATHNQLIMRYIAAIQGGHVPIQSESGIRTRCCELVDLGRVVDSGQRVTLCSGRRAIVWKVT